MSKSIPVKIKDAYAREWRNFNFASGEVWRAYVPPDVGVIIPSHEPVPVDTVVRYAEFRLSPTRVSLRGHRYHDIIGSMDGVSVVVGTHPPMD